MISKQSLKRMIDVAAGREKADLIIRGGKVLDVCNGRILEADIAVAEGHIVGLGEYEGKEVYDAKGCYISPGLIDAHIHIESSYCTPEEFGKMVLPHGTTTVIADPHEIANVCGIEGFRYMKEAAGQTALSVKWMLPSCVPATAWEDAGAVIKAADMQDELAAEDVPGLGEFMDYVAVVNADEDALDKILLAKRLHKIIDGHSPNVWGKDLNAYCCAGIKTDHECSSLEEMQERLQRGMYIQLRQGSACHNLAELIPGITPFNFRRCLLCSDDRQPKTILEEGHLEPHLQMLSAAGIEPLMALAMASLNAAECYRLEDRGAIAPGKRADLAIFEDLQRFKVKAVFAAGDLVAEDGVCVKEISKVDIAGVSNTVHVKDFSAASLRMGLKSNRVYAIEMLPGEVLSRKSLVEIQRDEAGEFVFHPDIDVVKCAVLERHQASGKVGLGFIKGYGMKSGAVAASVAHDSHNIICVGVSDEEMVLAVDAIIKQEGGFVIVKDGSVIESLPLPVAGLMSDKGGAEVARCLQDLHHTAIRELGIREDIEPLMTLTFMSLIVIPELKITARGLFDLSKNAFIEAEQENGYLGE